MEFENEITWKQYYEMKKDPNLEIKPMSLDIPMVKTQREENHRIFFEVKNKELDEKYPVFVHDETK